jgi:hypothetical protein
MILKDLRKRMIQNDLAKSLILKDIAQVVDSKGLEKNGKLRGFLRLPF